MGIPGRRPDCDRLAAPRGNFENNKSGVDKKKIFVI